MTLKSLIASYCGFLLICFITPDETFGTSVRTRFNMPKLSNELIRVVIPEDPVLSLDPKTSDFNQAGRDVYQTFKSMFGVLNFTARFVSQGENGDPDDHGNYTGLIGMVQRNETDTVFFMVRPDALPFEPVRIGYVFGSDEMVLVASRQPAKLKKLDVSLLFLNFGQLIYCYLAICSYFIIGTSMTISHLSSNRKKSKGQAIRCTAMLKHVYANCWSILELMLDQENYNPTDWSNRILWLFCCIASFVLVFGFFTNLMSTDLVAFTKLPELDSLEDLFTQYFQPMDPIILTNLPSYSLIKHADSKTSLGLLYQRLNRNAKYSIIKVNLDDSSSILSMALTRLEGIIKGQLCLATTNDVAKSLHLAVCALGPDQVTQAYHSSTFVQGLITNYYNKALPAHITNYLDFKGRNFHEMAIFGQLALRSLQSSIAEKLHKPLSWKFLKCFHYITDEDDGIEKAREIRLSFRASKNLFRYGIYSLCLATVVLLIECLVHRKKPKKKLKRIRIKRSKISPTT